jgi:hypothetical protein
VQARDHSFGRERGMVRESERGGWDDINT